MKTILHMIILYKKFHQNIYLEVPNYCNIRIVKNPVYTKRTYEYGFCVSFLHKQLKETAGMVKLTSFVRLTNKLNLPYVWG